MTMCKDCANYLYYLHFDNGWKRVDSCRYPFIEDEPRDKNNCPLYKTKKKDKGE